MAVSSEDAKNMALLFFMDHLMSKNGTRTIHDLSCQFGSRGFTEEMRDAVGTTQEGLCEFLRQFPSLFKLDGDKVSINMYGDLAMGGSQASPLLASLTNKDRDYEKEAVEFFENKLKKFGPELQIKSLLGHRSQAAPEIRLVSGRHVKDFTDFLQRQIDMFVVEGDRVRLKHMPEPSDPNAELDEDGQPMIGARAKQAAVDYLKDLLESQEAPVPMEALYREFCCRFPHTVRQDVATNPKELLQFLKLNRNIFFIRSNKVSLVKNRPGVEIGEDGEIIFPPGGDIGDGADSVSATSSVAGDFCGGDPPPQITVARSLKQAQTCIKDIYASLVPGSFSLIPGLAGIISLDAKMVNLGQDFLALVVVGTANNKICIFDVAHSAAIVLESGLKELLESPTIMKVIHDCRRMSAVFYQQYQVLMDCVFDTQAANAALQHQKTGRPCHEVKEISFLTLQRLYFPQSFMMSDSNPRMHQKRDQKFWSVRPMTEEMIEIAVEEVKLLIPTIYLAIRSALKQEYEPLLEELSAENVNFYIRHDEILSHRKERREQALRSAIDQKLRDDPSGASLTEKEKRMLNDGNNGFPVVPTTAIGFQSSQRSAAPRPPVPRPYNPAVLTNGFAKENGSSLQHPCPPFPPPQQFSVPPPALGVPRNNQPSMMTNGYGNMGSSMLPPSLQGPPLQQPSYNPKNVTFGDQSAGSGRNSTSPPATISEPKCACCCHGSTPPIVVQVKPTVKPSVNAETQTLSTSDIVITKLYYDGVVSIAKK